MWIALTETDLQSAITAPELAAAKTAAVASGQTGAVVVAEIIEQVTREIRGRVAACAKNQLGPDGQIPDECKSAAVDMCVYRLAKRLPGKIVLTDQRDKANTQAIAFLRDVAACEVTLQQPSTVSDENVAGPAIEIASSTTRKATRDKLSGL